MEPSLPRFSSSKNAAYFGTSQLQYADYEFKEKGYAAVPARSLNGGLYTGQPFVEGAPYRNFPSPPTTDHQIHHNLRSADPPPGAIYQYPHQVRLGNNPQTMPGVSYYDPNNHYIQCTPELCAPPQEECWLWK